MIPKNILVPPWPLWWSCLLTRNTDTPCANWVDFTQLLSSFRLTTRPMDRTVLTSIASHSEGKFKGKSKYIAFCFQVVFFNLCSKFKTVDCCLNSSYLVLNRYAGMGLTNLTFGDGTNKALLCSFRGFMQALVAQLASPSEDLRWACEFFFR